MHAAVALDGTRSMGDQMDQPAGTMVANSVQVRRESIARTIWLTRPDIRHLAGNDRSRFEAWLVLWGILEYRALVETESETGILDALLLPAPEACFGVEPQLTRLMTEVRNLRVDLKEKFSISSPDGQQEYAWWCVLDGAQQPEAWFSRIRAICEKQGLLTNPADVAYSDTAPVLTRFAHLVWRMRDDLQAAFDLKSEASRQDFMWWFFWFGSCEHRFDRYLTNEQLRFVHGPAEDIPTGNEPMPVSRLMARVWAQRPDLQNSFPLNADVSRAQFIAWFYAVGMEELQLTGLIDRHLAGALLEEVSPEVRVSRIGALLWVHSGMLRKKFPMPGAAEFSEWLRGEGACEFPLLKRLQDFSSSSAAAAPGIVKSSRSDHRGFNLIGYARGQFGIGEDVRMAAEAMKAAKVPFSIFNIEPGKEVSQDDASADCHISPDLPYGINLFCTTGIETARLAAVEGSRLFDGRLSIGAWPWELPEWPANWHHAYELVDEVWASSRYTQEAYLKSSPKSVLYMPMAVTVGLGAGHDRRYFGLPDNRFLFTFSFDALSGFARKNPWAVIRAFPQGLSKWRRTCRACAQSHAGGERARRLGSV